MTIKAEATEKSSCSDAKTIYRKERSVQAAASLQQRIGGFDFQQGAGNLASQRLLRSGHVQAKLTVNQPGDPYEQEADRVAEYVMRMPTPDGRTAQQLVPMKYVPVERQYAMVIHETSDDVLQRQDDESKRRSHPEIPPLEGITDMLEGWKQSLQEESAWIASQIPDHLVPGTAEYAKAREDLFDETLLFASFLGTALGKSYLIPRDTLSAEDLAKLDALQKRLEELIRWNAEEAYNELLGHLPRGDVINIRMGSGLPWPQKGVHYVGRLGNVEPDGVLTTEWLIEQGFVRLTPQPGLGVTEWRHPETGVRVILLRPKGKKKAD